MLPSAAAGMRATKNRGHPVASSSPCERNQFPRESRDSSVEPCDRNHSSSSSSSSSCETDPCVDSSPQVEDLSRSLTNNVSLSSHRPRRHSSPGSPSEPYRRCKESLSHSISPPPPSRFHSLNLMWLLVPAVLVFISVCVLWIRIQNAPSRKLLAGHSVRESKLTLREAFPEQPNSTWNAFFAELRPLLMEAAPTRPAVVLLAGGEKDVTVRCLARRLGGLATALLGGGSCRSLTPEDEEAVSEDAMKLTMDQEAQVAYARGDRCFQLSRLERLSKQQLLMMHAWCDGDHSPFPEALFLLVLRTPEALGDEEKVERFLLELFSAKVGLDEAGALNSRLANSVIVVREEKNLVHDRSCVHPM